MKKITKPSDTVLIDPNEPLILPDGTALVGRIEWFLYALCCLDYQNLPTPMSRIEEFANALITGEIPNIEPQSRAEQFFLAILDGNVSNLPQPQSRSEVLLDKLARGEFDLSDVEPIQSHYELLLAYLIKNGGIGNIDYVLYEFSEAMKTMYNTVEKPFKSLELSGNTKVNVLQESVENDVVVPYQVDECQGVTLTGTKETGSLDNLVINGRTLVNSVLEDTSNSDYVSFDQDYEGQSFTINGTNEGAIKSAILSGCTLVNGLSNPKKNQGKGCVTIVSPTHLIINHGENIAGEKASVIYEWFGGKMEDGVDYTLDIWILKNTMHRKTDPNASIGKINFNNYNSGFYSIPSNTLGHITYEVTTSKTNTGGKPYIETFNTCEGELEIQMVVRQGRNLEPIEKHFEGMASCEMPVLTTTGKNLFDESKKIEGFIDNASIKEGLNTSVKNTWTTTWIKAKPNTSYTMQGGNRNRWQIKSRSNVITFVDKKTITTLSDTECIRCYYCNETYTASNVQLEEATSATSYEPYKTNILHTTEEVVLRSLPNGVCDTFNVKTGEYTQRIGEIAIDGSENWQVNNTEGTTTHRFFCNLLTNSAVDNTKGTKQYLCDNLKTIVWNQTCELGITVNGSGVFIYNKSIELTINSVKEWLSQNHLKLQYELETPIIETVDLSIVDQNNTKIDKMHVFNDVTHVNTSSDELTPTVNIGKSVSYSTIIKPNTKYTVDLKRNDKPLTVNLGGTEVTFANDETRKVITTPSTLTNDKLSYYGMGQKCSNIMVLEGEVEGNVDYFTGMQSVKAPTVSTVGKNLFDFKSHSDKRGAYSMGYPFETNSDLVSGGSNLTYLDNGFTYITQTNSFNNGLVYYVKLKKQTNYNISMNIESNQNEYALKIFGLYENEIPLKDAIQNGGRWLLDNDMSSEFNLSKTFNSKDFEYAIVYIGGAWVSNAQGQRTFTFTNIQLEEGVQSTSYEPYKSTILSCNEDVVLRQVDDVKDQLYYGNKIKYFDEITFNGNESWKLWNNNPSDVIGCYVYSGEVGVTNVKPFGKTINDKLPNGQGGHMVSVEGFRYTNYFTFSIHKDKIGATDVNDIVTNEQLIKRWLRENNITVQYELETPVIEKINLLIVDQDNVTQTKLHTFNDTTHIMTSSDELIPIIECNGKLEYPVVIKPSTQYTILANTSANAHALNNIAFDLGGAKIANTFGTRKITVTTPSTLANSNLTITGEGAKIGELMVLEGNESDTLPYFEGMSSCKMPTLRTVGKNLLYKHNDVGNTYGISQFHDGGFTTREMGSYGTFGCIRSLNNPTQTQLDKNPTSVQKGKTYTISCEVKKMSGTSAKLNYLRFTGYNNAGDNYSWTNIGWNSAELNYDYNNTVKLSKTIECDCSYKHIVFAGQVSSDSSSAVYKITNIQLEESSSSTTYEDHKTSILSCNDDVTLRGIGDIKDELNLLTGELTERIGEIVLDGSENWIKPSNQPTNTVRFLLTDFPNNRDTKIKSNFKVKKNAMNDEIGIWCDVNTVLNLDTSVDTVDSLKVFLSKNPIKLQYSLATESVKAVDLDVVDQDGNTIPKIKSYNDVTHLEVSIPKQSLLPNVSAEVATDNSKDMSSLTTKHQEISEAQSTIEDNIQSQSDEIDTALMATTEIFESILE